MRQTYDVGNGIVIDRNGENLIVNDTVGNTAIPLVISQDDDLLLIDALKAARRGWEREENERKDRERIAAWNKDVIRSYKPAGAK